MATPIKLLIADDETEFLDTISTRLEMRGFSVVKAINGEEAIKAAQNNKFDLALLDFRMPNMDGKQVLKILQREHKYLEVIILTGYSSIENAVECTKLGAFDFLQKPYNFEDLLTVLNKAYQARMNKKFEHDQEVQKRIFQLSVGSSPLSILKELKKLDNEDM